MPPTATAIAQLPQAHGGLGLRSMAELASVASLAATMDILVPHLPALEESVAGTAPAPTLPHPSYVPKHWKLRDVAGLTLSLEALPSPDAVCGTDTPPRWRLTLHTSCALAPITEDLPASTRDEALASVPSVVSRILVALHDAESRDASCPQRWVMASQDLALTAICGSPAFRRNHPEPIEVIAVHRTRASLAPFLHARALQDRHAS